MGIASPDRPTYAPPLDGANRPPTLLGGGTPKAESEAQLAAQLGEARLPDPADGAWRIQLREYPITGHRSHAVLVLVGPLGETRAELNGLSNSRNFGKDEFGKDQFFDVNAAGPDGSKLIAHSSKGPTSLGEDAVRALHVATGSYDDIVRGAWQRGIQAADRINRANFDYKAHDPSYEFGGNGGQIQNSNSAAYTLGKAMGLDLDGALRSAGLERRFSGWGRDLLDPAYRRYVAPPTFPNGWTP